MSGDNQTAGGDGGGAARGCAGRRIAVLGLGSMGFGMAASLLRRGAEVIGFDPDPAAMDRLRARGGLTATSPAEAGARGALPARARPGTGRHVEWPEPAIPSRPPRYL